MNTIFSINELNHEGYFIERGAYIREGAIGLYFGLVTEMQQPKSLSDLLSKLAEKHVPCKEQMDGKKHWYYPNHEEVIQHTFDSFKKNSSQDQNIKGSQVFQQYSSSNRPQSINVNRLVALMRGKKVLIFTGAGISVTSGVPDMFQLEQIINEAFNPMNEYIYELIENKSEHRLKLVKELHGLFVRSEPSISHYRIADLVKLFGFDLITGNLDGLHEKTGITPKYYTDEKHVVENLERYDVLLTIGLGDEGNIHLTDKYHKANPLGKVIAINQEGPQYLRSCDYLISGNSDVILENLLSIARSLE